MTETDIHIPIELSRYAVCQRKLVTRYETNQVIKALDTWLVLKHQTRSGMLKQWNMQKQHLFTQCKVSESIFRHRLKVLADLDLVTYDRSLIRLCSWDHLSRQLEIDITAKFTIKYNVNDTQRLQDWLIATEIKENQSRQSYSIIKKVNKNPDKKIAITAALLKAGADMHRLKDPMYYVSWMQIVYRNDFVRASTIHDLLIEIRPDTNRGVKGMADAWKAKHPCTVTYWKRVLQKSGIIDVSKLQIQSQERMRNSECRVVWLERPKQTLLCLCDNITVMMPWVCTNEFKDNTNNENR